MSKGGWVHEKTVTCTFNDSADAFILNVTNKVHHEQFIAWEQQHFPVSRVIQKQQQKWKCKKVQEKREKEQKGEVVICRKGNMNKPCDADIAICVPLLLSWSYFCARMTPCLSLKIRIIQRCEMCWVKGVMVHSQWEWLHLKSLYCWSELALRITWPETNKKYESTLSLSGLYHTGPQWGQPLRRPRHHFPSCLCSNDYLQEFPILLLEAHHPAEFSSKTPAWKFLKIVRTVISWFRCVKLGLKLKSSGQCTAFHLLYVIVCLNKVKLYYLILLHY